MELLNPHGKGSCLPLCSSCGWCEGSAGQWWLPPFQPQCRVKEHTQITRHRSLCHRQGGLSKVCMPWWDPSNGTALLPSKYILASSPIAQSPQTWEVTWKSTSLTPVLCPTGHSTNNTPHVQVLEYSIWNKHTLKKLEKLVCTMNSECFCNACYGQSHFNAGFLLFYLPGKLLKDELYHPFIWEDLWQLSGLLLLLLPQCSSCPSALLCLQPFTQLPLLTKGTSRALCWTTAT